MASPWVELLADELHARARVPGPPFDMRALAVALGFTVRFAPDLGGPVGLLVGRTILVAAQTPAGLAITIGHELAHVIADEWQVFPQEPEHELEARMDAVAAALIVPRAHAAVALARYRSVEAVARFFGTDLPLLAHVRIAAIAAMAGLW